MNRIIKFYRTLAHGFLPWGAGADTSSVAGHLQQRAIALSRQTPSIDDHSAPMLSFVVPTYNTPPQYLADLITSFASQLSLSVELILSDDGSTSTSTLDALNGVAGRVGITVVRNRKNRGIAAATNAGISAARGKWIGLIDHDDALCDGAILQIQSAILAYPEAVFFYTDEIIADGDLKPIGYHLKPAFDPVLLTGVNYINHLSIYQRDRLLQLDGLRQHFEGSQDYDLLLRYLAGVSAANIVHIPYPAYLWRRTPNSYSAEFKTQSVANARKAITQSFQQLGHILSVGEAGSDFLHRPALNEAVIEWPLVSVIIPNKNSPQLITRVLSDLYTETDYPKLEVIIEDNGTTDSQVLALYERLNATKDNFRVDLIAEPFNFSRQINRGIRAAKGSCVLLLNNDIEVLKPDWLKEMVSCLLLPDVGIVGAKLLYPDRTIQHAGIIVGFGDLAGHWYHKKPENVPGPFARLHVRQSLSAVTGACMLISKDCIKRVGLLDESNFAVAYNDVDYCLRAQAQGLRTVWTPFAVLIHHESVSRGSDESSKNRSRFQREKDALQDRHKTDTFEDPFFNPWLTRDRSEPSLASLKALPGPRSGAIGKAIRGLT